MSEIPKHPEEFKQSWVEQAGDTGDLSPEEKKLTHEIAGALEKVHSDLISQASVSGLARIAAAAVREAKLVWDEDHRGLTPEFRQE